MGSEFYLADPKHKRRLFLGKVTGSFLCEWFQRQATPFESSTIVAALLEFGEQDAAARRDEFEPGRWRSFAIDIWAFCVTSDWQQDVRWESHDYEDEFLPTRSAWDMPKPDPEWKTIGSWYQRAGLDSDPLATETVAALASIE